MHDQFAQLGAFGDGGLEGAGVNHVARNRACSPGWQQKAQVLGGHQAHCFGIPQEHRRLRHFQPRLHNGFQGKLPESPVGDGFRFFGAISR